MRERQQNLREEHFGADGRKFALQMIRTVRLSRQDTMKRAAHAVNLGGIAEFFRPKSQDLGRFLFFYRLFHKDYITQEGFYYA